MAIGDRAMKTSLTIGVFSRSKVDNEVTQKVVDEYGAANESGKFRKNLLTKNSTRAVQKIASSARKYHTETTLPWGKRGERILPTAMFDQYNDRMNDYKQQFELAVKDFITNFPIYIQEASISLNQMHNPDDYPEQDDLKDKFKFEISISPIENADDFRVQLSDVEVERIKAQIKERVRETSVKAMKTLYDRLYDVTKKIADKLSEERTKEEGKRIKGGVFRNSLVENAMELTTILPKLNITNDPVLNDLAEEVRERLCSFSAADLRDDEKAREETKVAAHEVMEKMQQYMGVTPAEMEIQDQAA